ncbi:MAG TPA: helix-turn-helix transcriptional regulator [Candidatus Eremiobacteraceae bacterium]|nr:helix-turn-helix transcriptional regulator [Candidatus Eremiobacteraceae bacterium]
MRDLRVQRRWSQQELGERIGVSRQAIIAIENGRFFPSLPVAFRLARIFAKPVESIFSLED